MKFYKTRMGKHFFENQMPKLVETLEQIGN